MELLTETVWLTLFRPTGDNPLRTASGGLSLGMADIHLGAPSVCRSAVPSVLDSLS